MYLSVCICCYLVTLLHTKAFLAEINNDQEFLSDEYSGKVTEPNKENEEEENVADYDDYDYDIEKFSQTVDNVEKKANNEMIRAALADKITKALKGKRNELVGAAGSDYADIEYVDDDTDYRHSEPVKNYKKVRNVKSQDKIVVEF